MKVSLKKEIEGIPVTEMKDGDLAVILKWGTSKSFKGRVIQRYKDVIIALGKDSGKSWENVFKEILVFNECYVRLLEDGDELVIRK